MPASIDIDVSAIQATAVATVILAGVAIAQIRQSIAQTEALERQVMVIRDTAADELRAVQDQIAASQAQNEAVREAARAQLQPIVFTHAWQGILLRQGEPLPSFRYYLKNEGVGPALDVEHGIRTDEHEYTSGGERTRYRTLSADEAVPAGFPEAGGTLAPLEVQGPHEQGEVVYWSRFSNVFGERFETRNYWDASKPAEFLPLHQPESDDLTPLSHDD